MLQLLLYDHMLIYASDRKTPRSGVVLSSVCMVPEETSVHGKLITLQYLDNKEQIWCDSPLLHFVTSLPRLRLALYWLRCTGTVVLVSCQSLSVCDMPLTHSLQSAHTHDLGRFSCSRISICSILPLSLSPLSVSRQTQPRSGPDGMKPSLRHATLARGHYASRC